MDKKRMSFYDKRQKLVYRSRELAWRKAMSNDEFSELFRKARVLIRVIAQETVKGCKTDDKQKRYDEVIQQMKAVLKTLGRSFEDLEGKFFCDKCNDTGFTDDGKFCDCYLG